MQLPEIASDLDAIRETIRQENAIRFFASEGIQFLPELVPGLGKRTWRNFVQIMRTLDYPRNTEGIPGLFFLLKDLSWPGSADSLELLSSYNKTEMLGFVESHLIDAKEEDDTIWIAGIKSLVEKLDIGESDFKNQDVFHILDLAEW